MLTINQRIARTLKSLRQQRGWSLDRAAAATGVSKAMLGQIERQESSPTIAILWKIASGFNVSFSSFIEELPAAETQSFHAKGEASQLHPEDEKIRVLSLFPFEAELKFEVFLLELLPGCEHLSPAHQIGVIEHIIVAKGEMEILTQGQWQRLLEGEGLRFQANQPHGYRNLSSEIAIVHDLIHYLN